MTSTFCPLPWNHLFIDSMGLFYACCMGPYSKQPSCDDMGNLLHASQKGSLLKHWNSVQMKSIREQLSQGQKHSGCAECWNLEALGGMSYRNGSNIEWRDTEETDSLTPSPKWKFLDLRFGNFCNLACRMCTPFSSSRLIEEYELLDNRSYRDLKNINWFEVQDFWDELFQSSDYLEKVHVAGGEPFIIKKCWEFLRRLVESGKSKNIVLSYNTNLSVLPAEIFELWPKFKGVKVDISIDGIERVHEFIRYPLKWKTFESNMRKFDENYKALGIIEAHFHSTFQVYNAMRIEELCDFTATFKNIRRDPRFSLVTFPAQFDVRVLSESYRTKAADKIDIYTDKIQNGHNDHNPGERTELLQNLMILSRHLRSSGIEHKYELFKKHNSIYDNKRSQRTIDYIPEMAEVL